VHVPPDVQRLTLVLSHSGKHPDAVIMNCLTILQFSHTLTTCGRHCASDYGEYAPKYDERVHFVCDLRFAIGIAQILQ
jgi:hypothetical protein